jgi:CRISPR-associated endonuclease Csn1
VDAVVIALTNKRAMQMLSEAAVRAAKERRRRFGRIPEPWDGFLDEIKKTTDAIVVSHRVERKVSGPLHEETYYGSSAERDKKGNIAYYHIRKPLHSLSVKDIQSADKIIDKAVREAVQAKFVSLLKPDPKLFEHPENYPHLLAKDGREIPIKKVRLKENKPSVLPIGTHERQRHAVSGNNHHAEVIALINENGECIDMAWETVTMFEAYRRMKTGEPVIKRDHGENKKILFSLSSGESAMLPDADNIRRVVLCRAVSEDGFEFKEVNDARLIKDIIASRDNIRIRSKKALFSMKPEKITISPLGKVYKAND